MARSGRKRRMPRAQREALLLARAGRLRPLREVRGPSLVVGRQRPLRRPRRSRIAFTGSHRYAERLVVSRKPLERVRKTIPYRVQFLDPKRVLVCVRRKIRREVMFALGKGGKRGRERNRRRRDAYSGVSC